MRDYMPGQYLCDMLNRERDIADLGPELDRIALAWANGLPINEALVRAAELGWER